MTTARIIGRQAESDAITAFSRRPVSRSVGADLRGRGRDRQDLAVARRGRTSSRRRLPGAHRTSVRHRGRTVVFVVGGSPRWCRYSSPVATSLPAAARIGPRPASRRCDRPRDRCPRDRGGAAVRRSTPRNAVARPHRCRRPAVARRVQHECTCVRVAANRRTGVDVGDDARRCATTAKVSPRPRGCNCTHLTRFVEFSRLR